MAVVEEILAAKRGADGQMPGLREATELIARGVVPSAAPHDDDGPFRRPQELGQTGYIGRRRRRLHELVVMDIGDIRRGSQHVFGQREDDRSRPSRRRDVKRMAHVLRNPIGAIDLRGPLGERREHLSIVDFLEGFAIEKIAADLADEQHHRRRILKCGVDTDAGVGRARPARDHADTGTAGQLAVGVGHVRRAAFLAADDESDLVATLVEAVEDGEKALAGDAETEIDALGDQVVDKNVPAYAGPGSGDRHVKSRCDRTPGW